MKRLIFALAILLLLAVPAWGVARDLYPVQSPASMNWSASTWALTDGGTANEAKPAGGDTVYFTANSGDVTLDENSAALAEFDMLIVGNYGGTLDLGGFTLTVDGDCYLKGTIAGTGTIDAGEGHFFQEATVANGVTLLLTTSGSDVINWGGTGGSVNINATGTYTLGIACNSYALTLTAGTLAGGGFTWTVGAGGFTFTNGTISGELDVDLSAAAGAYTQTAGIIDTGAVLNVTAGSGGFEAAACTVTGAVNITVAVNTGTGEWSLADTDAITRLTINSGVTLTQSGVVEFIRLDSPSATAVLAGGANVARFFPATATDWGFLGSITGTKNFAVSPTATPLVFSCAINATTRTVLFSGTNKVVTFGGLTCGELKLAAGGAGTATLTIAGNSSGTDITLGSAAAATRLGALTLGAGYVHRRTGAILRVGTGATHALNPQGRCIFTGTFTGTGIVVTPTYEGVIDCFGVGRVTAVTATGRRLVVRRAVDASSNPVRSWNGDGCTNVRFLPRLIIGENAGVN